MATATLPAAVVRAATTPATRSPLLSRDEAAAYLGIKAQTLAAWASKGDYTLPLVKIGRLAKYRLTDLEAFVASNTVSSDSH